MMLKIHLKYLPNMFLGYFNRKLYVSYTTFYIIGALLAMQVPFVKFSIVSNAENLLSFCTFGLCQLLAMGKSIRRYLEDYNNEYKF